MEIFQTCFHASLSLDLWPFSEDEHRLFFVAAH